MIMIDKLAYWSRLRYKSPLLKSYFSIGSLLICVATSSFILSLITLGLMICLTVLSSKAPFIQYLKLMAIPVAFLISSAIVLIINITEGPVGLLAVEFMGRYFSITSYSLIEGIRIVVVSLASISCLYFLTLTTPMLDIICVLHRLACPKIIIELMMLIYRYIFVTLYMANAILTSQRCRLGNKDFVTELRAIGQMLSVLLIRSLNKSSQVFDAMESRCYRGEIRVLSDYRPAAKIEIVVVTSFLLAMLGMAALIKIYYPLL